MELNNSIVKKKWGHEYLVYRNDHLAIWLLSIDFEQETSFHCHCDKDTGLIVLDGMAQVSFINNKSMLKGLDKIQIFRGRFHSTKAISNRGITLLEVESPEDKLDLIRFSDKYGRENKGYETEENYSPKTDQCLDLEEEGVEYFFAGCSLKRERISSKDELIGRDFESVVVILEGGLLSTENKPICSPGHVISAHNLDFLLKKYDVSEDTEILSISRLEWNY